MPTELGANLGAESPLLIRDAYYDPYQPSNLPSRDRSVEAFLDSVSKGLKSGRPVDPGDAARTVFKALTHHIDLGQSAKVRDALPKDIKALWPESVGA